MTNSKKKNTEHLKKTKWSSEISSFNEMFCFATFKLKMFYIIKRLRSRGVVFCESFNSALSVKIVVS